MKHFIDIEIGKSLSFAVIVSLTDDKLATDITSIDDIRPYTKVYDFSNTNKRKELMNFIQDKIINGKEQLIGFNNYDYDVPMLLYALLKDDKHPSLYDLNNMYLNSGDDKANLFVLIKNLDSKLYNEINKMIRKIETVDVYQINHWDNDARRASLKWVAANLGSPDIVEGGEYFDKTTLTSKEKMMFVRYCVNDVLETIKIYKHSKDLIMMREEVTKLYGKRHPSRFYRMSNTEIGAYIIAEEIKMKNNTDIYKILKENRTHTKYVFNIFDEILFDYVKDYINTNEQFKKWIEPIINPNTTLHRNMEFGGDIVFDNMINKLSPTLITIGKGGGHGFKGQGVYLEDDNTEIVDFDVAGFYPEIVLQNNIYPVNTSPVFCEVYKFLKAKRKEYPKGTPMNAAYKESMNAVVGLSNSDPGSPFFDPHFFFRITINGQLLILIFIDMLCKELPLDLIMYNTDGCTIRIYKKDRHIFEKIAEQWQDKYGYTIEVVNYYKLLFNHINEYIGIVRDKTEEPDKYISYKEFIKGGYKYKVKYKGDFIPDSKGMELHKNTGMRIIARAITEYFVFGNNVKDVVLRIYNDNNIENLIMFCGLVRINSNTSIVYEDIYDNSFKKYKGKVMRYVYTTNKERGKKYYRSGKNGNTLLSKEHPLLLVVNNINELKKEDIDIGYYIKMISKNIASIECQSEKTLFSLM